MKDLNFLKNQLFAHRGIFDNTRIYENTISSFSRTLKYNFGIDLDVRITSDLKIVVFHDDTTERLLHVDEKIEKLTYDELCYMAKYQIPLLSDVLNLVNGSVPILIEPKSVTKKYLLESELANILDNYQGLFAIQSFYTKTLKWFYKNRPNYVIGYLIGIRNFKKDPFFKKYDFVNIRLNYVKDEKIKYYKQRYLVLGWDIKTKEELDKYKYVFDNLVCDNLLEIAI